MINKNVLDANRADFKQKTNSRHFLFLNIKVTLYDLHCSYNNWAVAHLAFFSRGTKTYYLKITVGEFLASGATAPATPLRVTPLIGLMMFHIKLKNIKIIIKLLVIKRV